MFHLIIVNSLFLTILATGEIKPTFEVIESEWQKNPTKTNMDHHWKAAGLQERGDNYWITGDSLNRSQYWSRFIPHSKLYQAWFGVYVVKNFEYKDEWYSKRLPLNSAKRFVQLAVIDQKAWLRSFGNSTPFVKALFSSFRIHPCNDNIFEVTISINSNSDTSLDSPPTLFQPPFSLVKALIDRFHSVQLVSRGWIKYDIQNDRFLAIYSSLAKYYLKNGNLVEPNQNVFLEIQKMRKGVKFTEY